MEIAARSGGAVASQHSGIPLDQVRRNRSTFAERDGEIGFTARHRSGADVLAQQAGFESYVRTGDGVVCPLLQIRARRAFDTSDRVAVEDVRVRLVDDRSAGFMVQVSVRVLRELTVILLAIWQRIRIPLRARDEDILSDLVAPDVRGAVEHIVAVVPDESTDVVFAGGLHEEVDVLPSWGCVCGDGLGGGPFADDEGDVGEVAADVGEVGVKGCFVGGAAPDGFAPGAEDEVVCDRYLASARRRGERITYKASSSGTESPTDS